MFTRLREWAGIRHDEDHKPIVFPDTFAAGLLSCVWCVSVWLGAIVTVCYCIDARFVVLVYPLALSAGAIVIERWIDD